MTVNVEFEPAEVNLTIYRGDTVVFEFTIDNFNLQGGTGLAQIRAGESRSAPLIATWTVDLVNNGSDTDVTLTLDSTDNQDYQGEFYWDLQITFGGEPRTYMAGTCTINPDISNT